jgi:hypothetical protein
VLIDLGLVSAGVLVVTDWIEPATRLRGLGLLIGMVTCTLMVVMKFNRLVGAVWDAGGRAERRRMELEAELEEPTLSVVRDTVPR